MRMRSASYSAINYTLLTKIYYAARSHSVLLTFTLPTWFLKEHPEIEANLFHNQLQLVSFWDVYQTMKHVASFPARPPVLPWEHGQQAPRGSTSASMHAVELCDTIMVK